MGTRESELEAAYTAYAERAWLTACTAFDRADRVEALSADDLELLSMSLLMLARDDDAAEALERAHHLYVEHGETLRAARSATWIGMNLAYRGLIGPATGWLGRAHRLLESWPTETAEQSRWWDPRACDTV